MFQPTIGVHNLSLWFYCAKLCYIMCFKKPKIEATESFDRGNMIHDWFLEHPSLLIPFNVSTKFEDYEIVGIPDAVVKAKNGLHPVEFKSYPQNRDWNPVAKFQIQLYTYIFYRNQFLTNPFGYLVNLTSVGLKTQKIVLPFNFEKTLTEVLSNLKWGILPPCKKRKCKFCLVREICKTYFGGRK